MADADVTSRNLDDVIIALHEGVFEQPYWSNFLSIIRSATGAGYASLVFRRADARGEDVTIIRSGISGPAPNAAELGNLWERLKVPYDALKVNRPYTLEEIVDLDDEPSQLYIAYLANRQIDHAIVIRVGSPDRGYGWLTLGRAKPGFSSSVFGLITRIAPHLSAAVRTLSELERSRIQADIARDAVHRLNFGWVTLDAKGCVVEIDAVAERLFRGTAQLRGCRHGHAFPIGVSGAQHELRDILADFDARQSARSRAMHLIDEPWLDMLLVPIPYRTISGERTPVAVGYVHGVLTASKDRSDQLKQLFGLTGSEARLALAMSQGKTIMEAAAETNLTVETARNYSKRIYAKTGTRGHADLVRILLASVVALT